MSKQICIAAGFVLLLAAGCDIGTEGPPSAGAAKATSGTASAQAAHGQINFVVGYDNGYQQALASGKPMLVFFTAEWCHFCHQMANEVFSDEQVATLSERFTCILVDADAERQVCQQFRVNNYPTIQFLSPRGMPLARLVGKKPVVQLMNAMQSALENVARRDDTESATTVR